MDAVQLRDAVSDELREADGVILLALVAVTDTVLVTETELDWEPDGVTEGVNDGVVYMLTVADFVGLAELPNDAEYDSVGLTDGECESSQSPNSGWQPLAVSQKPLPTPQ